ncbi:hypothetical protein [Streptomyces sp. NPDC057854]|uniref:hypothetical protein n=1 Tax=unclassified Streptomyces TaxID=2593676 RepID=UPI0036C4D31F
MSFEDPHRPARGRRRHASARRGRGALWLVAAGGAAVLGLGAVALTGGGGGPKRPAERGTGDGLPALIQADPAQDATTPAADPGTSRPAAPAPTAPATASGPATTAPPPSASSAPAPAETTAPSAAPTRPAAPATDRPGKGRGNGKGRR